MERGSLDFFLIMAGGRVNLASGQDILEESFTFLLRLSVDLSAFTSGLEGNSLDEKLIQMIFVFVKIWTLLL